MEVKIKQLTTLIKPTFYQLKTFNELKQAKISASLLRYSDVIPADKAFYEAGMAAR
jgi:hypothetical protein